MEITRQSLDLTGLDGGRVPVTVVRPAGVGPHPAVVLGLDAYGPNSVNSAVAERLAEAGYLVVAPDYHRGAGPADPEDYTDFTEVVRCIAALDFTRGAQDLLTAVRFAAGLDDVDPERIATWGYCTGATLALLAAELSDRVAAAVLFFPSQPWFGELTPATPVHPVDLLWALRCPALFVYGDQDPVLPPEAREELRARLDRAGGRHRFALHPGAGHAFTVPEPSMRHAEADAASWVQATAFLAEHLGTGTA